MPKSRQRKRLPTRRTGQRWPRGALKGAGGQEQKISQLLLEFIEPYREYASNDDELDKLICMGILAWNVALMPKEARAAKVEEVAASLLGPRSWLSRQVNQCRA